MMFILCGLSWNTRFEPCGVISIFASQKRVLIGCLQWRKNVDYLLIAKPVAINHLRIRHDCVDILWMLCRLCVVLSEDHDLCCFSVTGRSVSEICEIGEQGVSSVGSDLLVQLWNAFLSYI